jgi:hypothetical protein
MWQPLAEVTISEFDNLEQSFAQPWLEEGAEEE